MSNRWEGSGTRNLKVKVTAGCLVLLALLIVPAPLLPPHRFAETMQSLTGVGWQTAYLVVAVGLQTVFYGALGLLAALLVNRAPTLRGRVFQMVIVPVAVILLAIIIRSLKVGHLPVWINAVVPITSCLFGVVLGLGILYRRWKLMLMAVAMVIGAALWGLMGGASSGLSRDTEMHLQWIIAAGPNLPQGDARFGALLQTAFASVPGDSTGNSAVKQNRAAILAWGIAVGHPRLARFVGLNPDSELVRRAAAFGQLTTLQGRNDWPKHYALSAALAVLEHPLISDAGGLMKEQLDALTGGSGFSFGDLTADRAGVRFASAATGSEPLAKAMQSRLQNSFTVDDFFPLIVDFPENLTVDEFRRNFDAVGSRRYRQELRKIEKRLDGCAAISFP
jgi:hypothetical protein